MVKGTSKHGPGFNKQGVRDLSKQLKSPGGTVTVTLTNLKNSTEPSSDPRVCSDVTADALEVLRHKEPALRHFRFRHLPEKLRNVSRQFAALAMHLVSTLPANADRAFALHYLTTAKDNAVRAALPVD